MLEINFYCIIFGIFSNEIILAEKAMNQNENKGVVTTEKGEVWHVKVGVWAPTVNFLKRRIQETKLWEIKVILN